MDWLLTDFVFWSSSTMVRTKTCNINGMNFIAEKTWEIQIGFLNSPCSDN